MVPAQQGLHAGDAAGRQVDLRLVDEAELSWATAVRSSLSSIRRVLTSSPSRPSKRR
jgi:hypothetical protein